MEIRVTPNDLVRRGVWDTYSYYIIGTEKESEAILTANEEFVISERDAFIIGLLKTIETESVVYRFNGYINELLINKTSRERVTKTVRKRTGEEDVELDMLLVRKRQLDIHVDNFMNKFPEYWCKDEHYKYLLAEANEYIEDFKSKLEEFELVTLTKQNITYESYNAQQVKKLLKFQY